MKIINTQGIAQDALLAQVELIEREVKRLSEKLVITTHESERLEYYNLQLNGLQKFIKLGYDIKFDERENINSLDLHLIVNDILKVRFVRYGTKDDKSKFVFQPNCEHIQYFRSYLDTPNKVSVISANKSRIDKWIDYLLLNDIFNIIHCY